MKEKKETRGRKKGGAVLNILANWPDIFRKLWVTVRGKDAELPPVALVYELQAIARLRARETDPKWKPVHDRRWEAIQKKLATLCTVAILKNDHTAFEQIAATLLEQLKSPNGVLPLHAALAEIAIAEMTEQRQRARQGHIIVCPPVARAKETVGASWRETRRQCDS